MPDRLRGDQGRRPGPDLLSGAGAARTRYPGQLRRAWAGVDPADPVHLPGGEGGEVRPAGADGPGGSARRDRPLLCVFAAPQLSSYYSGEVLAPTGGENCPADLTETRSEEETRMNPGAGALAISPWRVRTQVKRGPRPKGNGPRLVPRIPLAAISPTYFKHSSHWRWPAHQAVAALSFTSWALSFASEAPPAGSFAPANTCSAGERLRASRLTARTAREAG
jgi:hypothetical protein